MKMEVYSVVFNRSLMILMIFIHQSTVIESRTVSVTSNNNGAGDDPLHSVPVRVAQCRAQCLDKFTWVGWTPSDTLCQEQPDCYMCWESCDLLNQNFVVWGSMCDRKDICFPGCQQACGFYVHGSIAEKSSLPVFRLKFARPVEFGVRESTNSLTLKWSKPEIFTPETTTSKTSHENNVVYVILRRTRVSGEITKWQQVTQTSEMFGAVDASLLSPSSTVDFKLIAVTGAGMAGQLVTSYHVASGVIMPQDGKISPTAPKSSTGEKPQVASRGFVGRWRLHLMTLKQNRRLGSVDAIITWASPGLTGNFLVTWEVKEGTFAIIGHLYTDSTTVSLTLWPETVYSVQVELVSETADKATRSEPLIIDTNVVSGHVSDKETGRLLNIGVCDDTVIIISGAVAFLIVIIIIVFRLCTRRDDAKMMSPADTVQYNNNGLRRAGDVRRKLSTITVNDPVVDFEAVSSPRPSYSYVNSPLNSPSSADLSSSLDERLSAFRTFLDNVEKMASTSPKPCNHLTAFSLPGAGGDTKVTNGSPTSNSNHFHQFNEVLQDEDPVSNDCGLFEATPVTEMLIKKKLIARRCMSTAM